VPPCEPSDAATRDLRRVISIVVQRLEAVIIFRWHSG